MPRAGLSEPSSALLLEAVADERTLDRYRAKVRQVAGSPCAWWTGAVSARGHGRFWLGEVDGRDVVVIAHRFGWVLEHGVDSLASVPVLGHRCDNPLCQRVGPGHVQRSSPSENAREWAARRHTIGSVLRDDRGSRGRSRALRDELRAGASALQLAHIAGIGLRADQAQLPLWQDV